METVIKDYDTEMEKLTELVNKEVEIFDEAKKELDEMEEKYRKVKHAKEVNKKLEDDWALKRQQFEIEENRKVDAAKFITKMWEAWKGIFYSIKFFRKEEEKKEEGSYEIINIFNCILNI